MTGHPSATADVLVVGGGPAGIAAATSLAGTGHRVVVVERDTRVRRTRGVALVTPATVATLERLGLADAVADGHRVDGIRVRTGPRSMPTPWPPHPDHADHGVVVHRDAFDTTLARLAIELGVEIWFDHEATAPIVERGFVRGAHLVDRARDRPVDARSSYLVVADGADSRFGRALGSYREPSWPLGVAHHGEYESELGPSSEVELVLGLRDRAGTPINGYGWMFPTGGGTVDVGVALMSTSPSFQVLDPAKVLDELVATHHERWDLSVPPIAPTSGGRIPLGRSVGPAAGPTWLLVGDAVAAADPWSGAGLDGALATGAIAGEVLAEALTGGTSAALQRYPQALDDRFGSRYGVGRLVNRAMGRPAITTHVAELASTRPSSAETFVRLGTAAFRPTRLGPAELLYRGARLLSPFLPTI